jgi:hypothetical protein
MRKEGGEGEGEGRRKKKGEGVRLLDELLRELLDDLPL